MPLLETAAPPWLDTGIWLGNQLKIRSERRLQFFDKQIKHEMTAWLGDLERGAKLTAYRPRPKPRSGAFRDSAGSQQIDKSFYRLAAGRSAAIRGVLAQMVVPAPG